MTTPFLPGTPSADTSRRPTRGSAASVVADDARRDGRRLVGRRARVLIVEDDADIRMLLRSVLSLTGFDVVDADGGAAALRILEDRSRPLDLAILDLRMPGVDGWGVLDRIRSAPETTDLPVIVCSVDATDDDIARGRDLGCDGYLQKPFEIKDLVGEVRAVAARVPTRRGGS